MCYPMPVLLFVLNLMNHREFASVKFPTSNGNHQLVNMPCFIRTLE
jgi:hypothetical protein